MKTLAIVIALIVILTAGIAIHRQRVAANAKPLHAPGAHMVFDQTEKEKIHANGRDICQLLAANDAQGLFKHFDKQMAVAVPLKQVETIVSQMKATGGLGSRVAESTHNDGVNDVYLAEYPWNNGIVTIVVSFDKEDQISGLLFTPGKIPQPDYKETYHSPNRYILPSKGEWTVFWGGNTEIQNYHIIAKDQRHAYDIVMTHDGWTYRDTPDKNENYYAWGQPILGPCNATVIEAVDGIADNKPSIMNPSQPAGNHILLSCGHNEYMLIAHFKQNSILVHKGDKIKAGAKIGECGNSGNSSEPHIHIHIQDGPKLFHAVGLPLEFTNIVVNGQFRSKSEIVQGDYVKNAK